MKRIAFPMLVLALVVAACSTPQTFIERKERASLPYEVMVRALGPAEVSDDGFEARFEFEVVSEFDLQRNSLVQELKQTITFEYEDGGTRQRQLSLVEAFKLRFSHLDGDRRYHYTILHGQSDRHSMRGMDDLDDDIVAVRLEREVFAYVANVDGADFTPAGFAHLPRNEDGNVVSDIPDQFNENYQRNYETTGWVWNSGDSLGVVYRIQFRLVRNGDAGPTFIVDRARGRGEVEMPSVLWRTK